MFLSFRVREQSEVSDDTDTAAGGLLVDFSEGGRVSLSVSLMGGIGHCPATATEELELCNSLHSTIWS